MSRNPSIVRNVLWNWAGMICDAMASFFLMPLLINRLGEDGYGTWVLIGSLSSYFGLLDLGVRGSVGRYVAFHRARDDRAALNATLSSALVIACGAGLVALVASLGLPAIFPRIFEIAPDQLGAVRIALLLIGLNIALSFPLSLFDGILWGFQRFDAINAIEVPVSILRAILTILVILRGGGIVGLAVLTVALAVLAGVAKAVMSSRLGLGLRIRPSEFCRSAAAELVSYGTSNLLISVARMIRSEVGPGLIGALISLPAVTFYAVGKRFIDYTERVVFAATGVMTPLTTALHASGDSGRQRGLFLVGGRYCLTMALFFVGGLILFGRSLITLWLGARMSEAATLLTILALGELIPLSQSISATVLLGVARHRVIAWFGFVEVALGALLAFFLAGAYGLPGVCAAIAISGAICRGMALLVSACRFLGVSVVQYLRAVVLPPAAMAAVVCLGSALLIRAVPAGDWGMFLAQAGLYAFVFSVGALGLLEAEHRGLLVARLKRRLFAA